jgi:hypothetical protein
METATGRGERQEGRVIKLRIPSRPAKQMTEKLQLVDAGLGERERTRGLPRSRPPVGKVKAFALVTVQTLSPRGIQVTGWR